MADIEHGHSLDASAEPGFDVAQEREPEPAPEPEPEPEPETEAVQPQLHKESNAKASMDSKVGSATATSKKEAMKKKILPKQPSAVPPLPTKEIEPKGDKTLSDKDWNLYNKESARPRNQVVVSQPSEEEVQKRKQWAKLKREQEERKARMEAEKKAAEDARKKEEEDRKAEQHRKMLEERMKHLAGIKAKQEEEKRKAEETAKKLKTLSRGKLLHEKLAEDFEKEQAALETAKKQEYDEAIGKQRSVRPTQIIHGEVTIAPGRTISNSPPPARTQSSPAVQRGRSVSQPADGSPAVGGLHQATQGASDSGGPTRGGRATLGTVRETPIAAKPKPAAVRKASNKSLGNFKRAEVVERACSPVVFGQDYGLPVPERKGSNKTADEPQMLSVEEPTAAPAAKQASLKKSPSASKPTKQATPPAMSRNSSQKSSTPPANAQRGPPSRSGSQKATPPPAAPSRSPSQKAAAALPTPSLPSQASKPKKGPKKEGEAAAPPASEVFLTAEDDPEQAATNAIALAMATVAAEEKMSQQEEVEDLVQAEAPEPHLPRNAADLVAAQEVDDGGLAAAEESMQQVGGGGEEAVAEEALPEETAQEAADEVLQDDVVEEDVAAEAPLEQGTELEEEAVPAEEEAPADADYADVPEESEA